MSEKTSLSHAKRREYFRQLMLAKMRASRHADASCFAYIFVLKEIAAIKIGISVDPLTRLCNLPQFHLRVQDVFDLERSIVVFAHCRREARALEQAALRHHSEWKVDAPSGAVTYVDGVPTCIAPIRWSGGGTNEWLHRAKYLDVLSFLLLSGQRSPRRSISVADWLRGCDELEMQ